MRFGAYVTAAANADATIAALKSRGYRAAYCPEYIRASDQREEIAEFREACARADIVIAEVGTWVNPLSPREDEARAARRYIADRLRVADALAARCCVNVIGSRSPDCWYGYHPENFSRAFFDEAVSVYRSILGLNWEEDQISAASGSTCRLSFFR